MEDFNTESCLKVTDLMELIGTVAAALHHTFGASLIWCLVNRGEVVYTTMDPLDMDVEHQRAW